jgi:hypothetical protein
VYHSQTMPVISHYEKSCRFRSVGGEDSVEVVSTAIIQSLRELRAQFPRGAC